MSFILSSESFSESGKYANQDNLKIAGPIFITCIIWSLGIHPRGIGVSFGDTKNPSGCFPAQPNVGNCLNKGLDWVISRGTFQPLQTNKKIHQFASSPYSGHTICSFHFSFSFLNLFSLVEYNCHENNPQSKFLLQKPPR